MTEKKNMTIKDIAQRANVAISTVSRVLNNLDRVSDETRAKVNRAIQELGYVPNSLAASMVTGHTKVILLIVPDFVNSFYGAVIQGAEKYLRSYNYLTMVASTEDKKSTELSRILQTISYAVDGAIIVPPEGSAQDLTAFHKPIVLVDRSIPDSHCSTVTVDNFGGIYQLTKELLEAGHRNIGIIAGSTQLNIGRDRLDGYLQALQDYQAPVQKEYIMQGELYEEDGYRLMHALLQLDRPPSAVVACNNLTCIGCVHAIQNAGLMIGQDISLVGFDDHQLASVLNPGITVIDRPTIEMGEKAATLLLEQFSDPTARKDIVMDVNLIRRGSIIPYSS